MEDQILIKAKMRFIKREMRQTKVSFGLKKLGLHVKGEEKGEEEKEEKKKRKKREKRNKVCFCIGIMCILDSYGFGMEISSSFF